MAAQRRPRPRSRPDGQSTVDRILDVLDSGLQHASPAPLSDRPDLCARCQNRTPKRGGHLCAGCRAFMRGASRIDPAAYVDRDPPQDQAG